MRRRFKLDSSIGRTMIDTERHCAAVFAMADVAASAVERCNIDPDCAIYFTWISERAAIARAEKS